MCLWALLIMAGNEERGTTKKAQRHLFEGIERVVYRLNGVDGFVTLQCEFNDAIDSPGLRCLLRFGDDGETAAGVAGQILKQEKSLKSLMRF